MKKFIYGLYSLVLFAAFLVNADIEQHHLTSKNMAKQQVFDLSLPSSYQASTNRHYPVIYVLHAQWDMPLVTSILTTLAGEVPEFIVVGVRAKGKQLQPLSEKNMQAGSQFRQFFEGELIPHIAKNYRVANYSLLLGHSNSGRYAMEQLLKQNALFRDYFVFSPSLEDGYLTGIAHKSPALKGNLFLSLANEGEHMETPFDEMTKILEKTDVVFTANKYPEYTHQSSKIVALVNAFQTRFADWKPSYETKIAGFKSLMTHYQSLTNEFGFDVLPHQDDLVRLIAYFAIQDNKGEVTLFSQMLITQYDDGKTALKEMKEYLAQEGYEKASKRIHL